MNPQDAPQGAQAAEKPVDPSILKQIIEQYEETNRPFGAEDYSESDAKALGLPSPAALNFLNKFVKKMMGTPFVPDWISKSQNPAGTMLACIIRGREMGFQPLESTEVFWKAPDGRLGLYSKPMTAIMLRSGAKIEHLVDTDEEHSVKGTRTDGNTYTSTFTKDDAFTAGLLQKNQSMHVKYPRRMFKWRSLSDLFNTLFADLTGTGAAIYTAEELQAEFDDRNGDRGDNSDRAFQEEARRQTAENPYHVGKKSDQPQESTETSTQPNATDATAGGKQATAAAEPEARTAEPATSATGTAASPAPVTHAEMEKAYQAANAGADPQRKGPVIQPTSALKEELGKALAGDSTPPPNPASVAPTNVVEMPKAMSPIESKVMTSDQVKKALTDLAVEFMPGVSPETVVRKNFPEFMRGFFNIGKLPSSSADYPICLAILRSILKNYRAQFNQSSHGVGTIAGANWQAVKRFVANWPEDMRDLAYAITIERYPYCDESESGSYFIDYMNDPVHYEMLDEGELRIFLVILMKTSKAMLLQDLSVATSRGMAEIVLSWKLDLEKATEDEILALLKAPVPAATQAATQQQAAAAPAAPAPKDEFDDLFSDMEPLEDESNA